MPYIIVFKPSADRQLSKIPERERYRIFHKIESLLTNPRPPGAKKLNCPEGYYRIRVGDYRIIYDIQDKRLVIAIIRIVPRREAYR